MRIDAHHSFTDRYTLGHLGTILKRNRFEGSVLVYPGLPEMPEFIAAIVVETDAPDLDQYRHERRFRGIRTRLRDDALFAELECRDLSLDFSGELDEAARIADRFPNLRIAIEPEVSSDLERIAAFPNVYCKVNGLEKCAYVTRTASRRILAAFDPGHIMFASHWPECLPDLTWKAALAAFTQAIGAQPMEIREQLLGETARRFYRIETVPAHDSCGSKP